MPKHPESARVRAAVAAGDPPDSAAYLDDDKWHAAQVNWLAKWSTRLLAEGPQRRQQWKDRKKEHVRLVVAAAKGAALQPKLTRKHYRKPLAHLINYGSQPGQWQPSGGDQVPDGWIGDGMPEHNPDPQYLGMPDLTSFCTLCNRIRPGEPHLSRVEARPDSKPMRAYPYVQACHRCATSNPPEDCDPEGW